MLSVQGNVSTIGRSSDTSAVDAVVSWLLLVVKMERFGRTDGEILLGLVLSLIQFRSVGLVFVVVVVYVAVGCSSDRFNQFTH